MKHRAIFRDDPVEDIDVVERIAQADDFATGDENQSQARGSGSPQGGKCLLVYDPFVGDRSIVVGGKNLIPHDGRTR